MRLSSEEGDPSARSREDGRAQDPSERSLMFAQILGKKNEGFQAPTRGGPVDQVLLLKSQADASEGVSTPTLGKDEAQKPTAQNAAQPLGKATSVATMLEV